MERYVDGFLIPIALDKVDRYREIAGQAGAVWKEHGALDYYECIGDDLEVKDMVSFRKAAGAAENETVVFSWIVYPSREDRDRINAAVMNDPRIKQMAPQDHPFDYRRMAYGGFRTLVVC
ncbi:MAG TPA: DUF1428 domain-containing protein [Noviherbaspirillum sp.]|uniref:DUF1428 domain-containing protein n=1 Tax=Noviherbaspirillum sp. TaxID=1926288 RepID=UPI002F95957D